MDFRFLIAADIHLDSPLVGLSRYEGAPVEILRGATRAALRNLVALAIGEKANFVLLSGDIVDGDWKDYHTGLFLVRELSRLREAGVLVFAVFGNHDAQSVITKNLRLPDNVRVLSVKAPETVILEDLGVAIHGQGYTKRDVLENLADAYPLRKEGLFNVGLLHTALGGAEGHEPYAPCSVSMLEGKRYDVWALGHVHVRNVPSERDPLIIFPGNLQGRHARETGSKGATLVAVRDGQIVVCEHRDCHVLRWETIIVNAEGLSDPLDVVDVAAAAVRKEADKGPDPIAARLLVRGACKAHRKLHSDAAKWAAEVRGAVMTSLGERAWVEKVVFDTSFEVDSEALRKSAGPLPDLLRRLGGISNDDRAREIVEEEIRVLRERLPADVFEEGVAGALTGKDLSRLSEDAGAILTERILSRGDRE